MFCELEEAAEAHHPEHVTAARAASFLVRVGLLCAPAARALGSAHTSAGIFVLMKLLKDFKKEL